MNSVLELEDIGHHRLVHPRSPSTGPKVKNVVVMIYRPQSEKQIGEMGR